IRFTRKDIRDSSYQASHLDAIWAGYSLFHMAREDFEAVLTKIRKALVPDGIFGLIMQEGKGEVRFPEPLSPGKSLLVCLYSIKELTAILGAKGFNIYCPETTRTGVRAGISLQEVVIGFTGRIAAPPLPPAAGERPQKQG